MESHKSNLNEIPVLATTADDLSRLLCASIELEQTKKELKTLKSMTRLSEFSIEEIAFALVAIKEAQHQAIHHLAMHEVLGTNPEHDTVKFWESQRDMSITWIVQLETAKGIVISNETVNAN